MFRKIKRYIRDPYHEIGYDMLWKHPNWMSDKWYLKALWKRTYGYELDLKHPKTFSEKLQWLKLYDRKPIYTTMVDKYCAKQWIAEKIGEQYVIPTLAVYDSVDDIDMEKLPNQFVLKCNHDSGNVVICRDKSKFDLRAAKQKLAIAMKNDYYMKWREWPYKNVKRCVFVEKFLEEPNVDVPADYKFYCFNGEPKLFYVTSDKGGSLPTRQDFFDIKGNHLEIQDRHYPNNPIRIPELPVNLDEMCLLCRVLSEKVPHLRVDFYELNGMVYVGELTLYEGAGFCEFAPDHWNYTLGDWIKLPTDNN